MSTAAQKEEVLDEPIFQTLSNEMKNPKYSILVQSYAFGQFRIQLTRVDLPDGYAPEGHGSIVREMCTYKLPTCVEKMLALTHSEDPEATAQSWATENNCEGAQGRIRLDQ